MRVRFACAAVLIASAVAFPAWAEESTKNNDRDGFGVRSMYDEKKSTVEVVADSLEYNKQEKKVIAQKNVVITYENLKMTADYAEVETESKKAYARGHVIFFRDEEPSAQGPEAYYDFENKTGDFPDGRLVAAPWFGRGKEVHQVRQGVADVQNGGMSTCDREKPHYEIRARKARIYANDKIVARNVTVYVLGKPMFWWPYLVIPLQNDNIPLTVNAGYNSDWGAYVETTKGMAFNKNLHGKLMADWRSLRGFGGGGELSYDYARLGHGSLLGYWTQDRRAPTPGLENPYSEKEERDRGRIRWRHRTDIDPYTNIIARYERLADEYFLQDFFEKEYRSEVEPQSFVTLTKNSEKYGILIHGSKKMNSFEGLVERLPEVRLGWKNQPFLHSGIFYESQASFSNLAKRFKRSDDNEDVVRADTAHTWTVPLKWEEIKVTPWAELRETMYSREKESDDGRWRNLMGGGVDIRTQFYKKMDVTYNGLGMDVNGLRHILEPSVNFKSYYHSSVSDEELSHFDYIDTFDNQEVVTFGLENRLQTKRVVEGKMRRVDLVSLNTFLNYAFHPDDEDSDSKLMSLDNELVLRPYEWLQYQVRMDYNMKHDQIRALNQDLITRFKRFRILFGQRYDKEIGSPEDPSNQFVFEGKWLFNPLWQFGGYIRWDSEFGELQEWQISATRDLHCWLLDFGYNVRNSDLHGSDSNKELFFSLRMKAEPDVYVRAGGSRSSFAAPRIGETVSGANLWAPTSEVFNEGYWN